MLVVLPGDDTVFLHGVTQWLLRRVRGWTCESQVKLPDAFGKKSGQLFNVFYKPIKITEMAKKMLTAQLLK